jgi:cupin 2 domain-containing protein
VHRGRLDDPVPASGEAFRTLATLTGGARVEHIVSSASPDPGEQVQPWDEWVLLVAGAATLDVAGERVDLAGGDWLLLPAGTAHRVLATSAGARWLAVHAAGGPVPREVVAG